MNELILILIAILLIWIGKMIHIQIRLLRKILKQLSEEVEDVTVTKSVSIFEIDKKPTISPQTKKGT